MEQSHTVHFQLKNVYSVYFYTAIKLSGKDTPGFLHQVCTSLCAIFCMSGLSADTADQCICDIVI